MIDIFDSNKNMNKFQEPLFLADKTSTFSTKKRRFLREKARNKAISNSYWFSKTWFYAMQS